MQIETNNSWALAAQERAQLLLYGQSSLVYPSALPYLKAALLFPVSFPALGLWCGVCSRETECKNKQTNKKQDNCENKHPLLGAHPWPTHCWFAHTSGRILTQTPAPSTVKTSLRSSQAPCLVPPLCSYRAVQGALLGTGLWQLGGLGSGFSPAGLTCEWILCYCLYFSVASSIRGLFLYSPGNSPQCPHLFNLIIQLGSGDWLRPSAGPVPGLFWDFQQAAHLRLPSNKEFRQGQDKRSHFSCPFSWVSFHFVASWWLQSWFNWHLKKKKQRRGAEMSFLWCIWDVTWENGAGSSASLSLPTRTTPLSAEAINP